MIIFPQKIEIGDGTEKGWLNFKLSPKAKELHIQRCNEAILRDIKDIGKLTVINTATVELGIFQIKMELYILKMGESIDSIY